MARVYVGNLPMNIRESEIEDLFAKYGRIREIDLKTPARPPAYAFVSFDDYRDAEDAVDGRNGMDFDGYPLRVEIARGRGGRDRGERDGGRRKREFGGRRSDYRVVVSGLPPSASWQDLKDHMREAGDVLYTEVDGRGGGIVEYAKDEDMEYALRKLDDTEFKNPFDKSVIRVTPDGASPRGKRRRTDSPPPSSGRGDRRRHDEDDDGGYAYEDGRGRGRPVEDRDDDDDYDRERRASSKRREDDDGDDYDRERSGPDRSRRDDDESGEVHGRDHDDESDRRPPPPPPAAAAADDDHPQGDADVDPIRGDDGDDDDAGGRHPERDNEDEA